MSLSRYFTQHPALTEGEVEELLARALRNVQIFKPHRSDAIYITEAVQPCLRKVYFDRLHPQPPSVATVVGEYLHNLLQEEFRALGYRTEVGLGLDLGDFKLVGRADVVLEDDDGNTLDVVEIKTVGRLPDSPRETHVLQLQVYIELLEAPRGTLLYVDRNRGQARLFDVRPDPQALDLAVANAKVLWRALTDFSPPPPHYGAWCVFCPHQKRCRVLLTSVRREV